MFFSREVCSPSIDRKLNSNPNSDHNSNPDPMIWVRRSNFALGMETIINFQIHF